MQVSIYICEKALPENMHSYCKACWYFTLCVLLEYRTRRTYSTQQSQAKAQCTHARRHRHPQHFAFPKSISRVASSWCELGSMELNQKRSPIQCWTGHAQVIPRTRANSPCMALLSSSSPRLHFLLGHLRSGVQSRNRTTAQLCTLAADLIAQEAWSDIYVQWWRQWTGLCGWILL